MRKYDLEPQSKEPTECLELRGMVYVPSYDKKGFYAIPGGSFISELTLREMGAIRKIEFLWPRPK